mgnify:CR=1 FL=1
MRCLIFLIFLCFQFSYSQQFRNVNQLSGINHISNNNGVAIADYDIDGDLDIFVVSYFSDGSESNWSRLLENQNDGSFIDVTENAGFNQSLNHEINLINVDENGDQLFDVIEQGDRLSASWGDFNNDGYPDIFLGNAVQSQLYKNNGNGTFTDITETAGFQISCEECYIAGALWLDYDLDGLLDIFLSDYNQESPNRLYRNLGDETFEEVDIASIPHTAGANSFSAIPIYANDDIYPDIYIANDYDYHNQLLINQNGEGFENMVLDYGLEDPYDGMGLATCDFNNDLKIDLLITNIRQNSFYVRDLQGSFLTYTENSEQLNIKDTGWAWGAIFSDFDHDGYEDFYVANGFWDPEPNEYYVNVQVDNGNYFLPGYFSEDAMANEYTKSRSVNSFDYDNDGDLDLIYSSVTDSETNTKLNLWENRSIDSYYTNEISGNWVKFNLEGTISNRDGLGSIVQINFEDGTSQIRHYTGSGYQQQSLQSIHFGAGEQINISNVSVTWPSSGQEIFYDLQMNSTYLIVEGQGIELIDNNTSIQIEGCTNIYSCNYNPIATVDDGTCAFISSEEIIGENIVEPLIEYSYSYEDESIISYEWEIENGVIISGNGTSEIIVRWDIANTGNISLIATDQNCSTNPIDFSVAVELPESYSDYNYSIARLWNEVLLFSIRNDLARPTVHARNLFHTSAAMYDAWSVVNNMGSPYLLGNIVNGFNSEFSSFSNSESTSFNEINAISYSAYRIINHRFSESPGYERIQEKSNALMNLLNLDKDYLDSENYVGNAASLGNYIAENYIQYGITDGSNENMEYANLYYNPVNEPMSVSAEGNPNMTDPNRWQPLSFDVFVDQSGNVLETNTPRFLGAEWGNVSPFGLNENDMTQYERDGNFYNVYHDPGFPPLIDDNLETNELFIESFLMVPIWGSHLSPVDETMWDISPNSLGNVDDDSYPTEFSNFTSFYDYFNGGDTSQGYNTNPVTGETYEIQNVLRGDYARVLAEYWADGPDSETPPGHWFVLLNSINDNPQLEKKFKGQGEILSDLEWDIKSYFILGGVMHDVAVSVWGIKGWYDYVRPISVIRYFSELGQSTDTSLENFDENGFTLIDGLIEIVQPDDPLAVDNEENIGKIKLYTWKGHEYIDDIENEFAGVGWILAENWWPYQRPTFVTPNFAGYVSGHSTFSRAAAEMLENFTGSPYFPGGLGTHLAKQREFLVFEDGPSQDVELQWVSYKDAADQCSLSRIWGGIHPYIDDIPGRLIGQIIGNESFEFGAEYFEENLSTIDTQLPKLRLLKNPIESSEQIQVLNTTGDENFRLYDISGKEISIKVKNENRKSIIYSPSISKGFYILQCDSVAFKVLMN